MSRSLTPLQIAIKWSVCQAPALSGATPAPAQTLTITETGSGGRSSTLTAPSASLPLSSRRRNPRWRLCLRRLLARLMLTLTITTAAPLAPVESTPCAGMVTVTRTSAPASLITRTVTRTWPGAAAGVSTTTTAGAGRSAATRSVSR